ncbi:TMEM43 family protein [Roseococcus sp. SYP-B2431]|uniref:TMEM43 family protein n=1 Tax=Roseococcus sp. SYP-B2431 TaxID=2496640 RepID=UPI0013F3E833|nr:TMEM43 family protein [Roseococcus sp. SYP-B2431]
MSDSGGSESGSPWTNPGGAPGGADTFTSTSSQSWFSRIGSALVGLLIGLVLIPGSGFLLFWNEGRAVQTARSLTEGAGLVRDVPADRPDGANEGRLVHVSGPVRVGQVPLDAELDARPPDGTLRLVRNVEMFQWLEENRSETRTRLGGGTETVTTSTYRRGWHDGRVDSSRFRQPDGHQNPALRYQPRSFNAQGVTLGGFRLSDQQIGGLPADQTLSLPSGDSTRYIGGDPNNPRVGDLRITWRYAQPSDVSVIAAQAGDAFGPYATNAGDRLMLIRAGTVPAPAMFQQAQDDNALLTWILRLVGVVLMFVGWALLFNPLKVLADVIPPLGAVVGFGTGALAAVLTALVAPVVIAIAWLFYRPLVGIAILAAGLALAYGFTRLRRRRPQQEKLA